MTPGHDRWLEIDGATGEGGGQIVRTSLGLSLVTGRPVHLRQIRAGRKRPGLLRQHLTAVNAAAAIGQAEVVGDKLGSRELRFRPSGVYPGSYTFSVGTAGSTTLVLQAVLPALLLAAEPTTLVLEGGTHNPFAPPFDFLERAFLPLVDRIGARVEATLQRPGFFPAGGGRVTFTVTPAERLEPLWLEQRGRITGTRAVARVAALPPNIGHRELQQLRDMLNIRTREELVCEELDPRYGPGNVVFAQIECEHVTELFAGFGQKGIRAERVAKKVGRAAQRWLAADVPVGEHLADQLILLLALAGGGAFRTLPLTSHARTQLELVERFIDVSFTVTQESSKVVRVEVAGSIRGDG